MGLVAAVSRHPAGTGGRVYSSGEELNQSLTSFVELMAKNHQFFLEEHTLPDKFGGLIEKLHQTTNRLPFIFYTQKKIGIYAQNE
jgi:hypothetical protein